jgi:hypothetical protein
VFALDRPAHERLDRIAPAVRAAEHRELRVFGPHLAQVRPALFVEALAVLGEHAEDLAQVLVAFAHTGVSSTRGSKWNRRAAVRATICAASSISTRANSRCTVWREWG